MNEPNRPNIVLITTDQMRADALGVEGNSTIQTPHLDGIARRGVRFAQAYSPTPVCIPARATIMTGLEGHRLGLTHYKEGFVLPVKQTLPRLLSDAGYETRAVGKMHTYPERCHYGFDSMLLCEEGRRFGQWEGKNYGFDDYEQWLAEQGFPGQAYAHGISPNEYAVAPWHLEERLHPTAWVAHESCRALKRRDRTRPMFLWASFTAPHPPLTPPVNDLSMYKEEEMPERLQGEWSSEHALFHQRLFHQYGSEYITEKQRRQAWRGYYALITQVDRAINRILGTLREEGMSRNTWIVFTSDHGDNMGDHGLWFKSSLLQGACRVPFLIQPPPGVFDDTGGMPGRECRRPVGLQDLMPTCLDIAGAAVPTNLDGRSLLALMRNPDGAGVREALLGEFGRTQERSFMLTDGEWKYLWFEEDGEELLFRIGEDPNERTDLSATHPEQTERWRMQLAAKLASREGERAVRDGALFAANPDRSLSPLQAARMLSDGGPRGLH